MHINTFCVLCGVKANKQKKERTKTYNKETVKFPNQFALSTMDEQRKQIESDVMSVMDRSLMTSFVSFFVIWKTLKWVG